VYAVAGGNRVTILVDAAETGGAFDLIEVLAQPGGGPPPHRHAFAEWFHVLDGALQLLTPQEGELRKLALVEAGSTYVVSPWAPHTTHNTTDAPVRFIVAGQPGVMSSYFAQAGVRVADTHAAPGTPPPGPDALAELAARYEIEFVAVNSIPGVPA
jgi:mannose-6-phosphate isomerase-like protein (cupin superfamily)